MIAVPGFLGLVVVFTGFGDRLARLLGLRQGPIVERLSLSFVLSAGTVTLTVFGLAAARWLSFGTCLALAAAMAVASFGPVRDGLRSLRSLPWRELAWPAGRVDRLLSVLTGAFLATGLLMALAPPTGMDTGVYHFTIPKVIVQNGGLIPREDIWIHKSGGFYLFYAFGMALGGEVLAKLLAFAMAVAGVGLCGAVAERLRTGAGRIAAFILVSTPLSAGYLGYEYLELPILTYLLAGLLALLRGPEGKRWAVLACAFTGLGVSAKPSAFAMAILVPAALGSMLLRERGKALAATVGGLVVFGATSGFWMLWNYLSTGLLLHRYPGPALAPEAAGPDVSVWTGLAILLKVLATTGKYWTDSSGPFILAGLAGFAFFPRQGGRPLPIGLLLVSLAGYVGGLAVLTPIHLVSEFGARYFAPCMVGFGAPAAAQFAAWARERQGLLRGVVLAALILPAAPLLVLKAGKAAVAAPVALGVESRSAYLGKKIETFAACQVLNALPASDVKVLFVGVRPYYLDRPFVWIPYTGHVSFLRGVRTREDFLARVHERGITHVLYEPAPSRDKWFHAPDELFTPPFREIGRWPWKQGEWVRLYAVERP